MTPMMVVVFALLAVIFMGISLVMPWYKFKEEKNFMEVFSSSEQKYDLFGVDNGTGKTAWAGREKHR